MIPKAVPAPDNLLDELQSALSHGTVARRVETLRRVTDLFVNGAVDYSDEQIALFDDVFQEIPPGLAAQKAEFEGFLREGVLKP